MTAPQPAARPGRACPPFAFRSVQGQYVSSRDLLGRKALAIVFSDVSLAPDMLAYWETLARRYPNDLALVLVGALPADADVLAFIVTDDAEGIMTGAFEPGAPPVGYFIRRDGLITRLVRGNDPLLTDPAAFKRLVLALIG